MSNDIESSEVDIEDKKNEKKGLSQSAKEDLQTYLCLILVIVIGTIITIVKIVTIDINDPDFSTIFGDDKHNSTSSNMTNSPVPE